tara:strand:+ start:25 stop:552 length:528 start_codon:yes stop_codon:yes gene_type:complete
MSYIQKLLVASPQITGPIFQSSVIFVYEDTDLGTAGLVLNKPSSFSIVELARLNDLNYMGPEMIYKGGPVNDQAIIMLHTDDWYCSSTMQVGDGFAVTSDKMMLEKLVDGNTPEQWRIFSGVAAWQKGQLDFEIKRKDWLVTDATQHVVFDVDKTTQWQHAINLCSKNVFDNFFG